MTCRFKILIFMRLVFLDMCSFHQNNHILKLFSYSDEFYTKPPKPIVFSLNTKYFTKVLLGVARYSKKIHKTKHTRYFFVKIFSLNRYILFVNNIDIEK